MARVRLTLAAAWLALLPACAFAYTLGPGDEIAVEVTAAQTHLSLAINVSVDGRIVVAPAGAFLAQGKTPAQLEAEIAQALEHYFVGPVQVTVLVQAMKTVKVSVLGQVARPGQYRLEDDEPLLSQAIALAGGLTPQASSRRVSLVRGGREVGPVDLHAILKLGRAEQDVVLRPDDVIYLPAREAWATLLGPVREPGVYELLPGDRLSALVLMAGGLGPQADQRRAVIERRGESGPRTIEVNLDAALLDPRGLEDPELLPGDTVRLASRADQVYVLGQVVEPGAKPYEDNRNLLDYIGSAGGVTPRAITRRAAVVRPDNPHPQVIPVDVAALMSGQGKPPPQLQPGDIIFVPERRVATIQDWSSIGQVLATLIAGYRVF